MITNKKQIKIINHLIKIRIFKIIMDKVFLIKIIIKIKMELWIINLIIYQIIRNQLNHNNLTKRIKTNLIYKIQIRIKLDKIIKNQKIRKLTLIIFLVLNLIFLILITLKWSILISLTLMPEKILLYKNLIIPTKDL